MNFNRLYSLLFRSIYEYYVFVRGIVLRSSTLHPIMSSIRLFVTFGLQYFDIFYGRCAFLVVRNNPKKNKTEKHFFVRPKMYWFFPLVILYWFCLLFSEIKTCRSRGGCVCMYIYSINSSLLTQIRCRTLFTCH